MKKEILYSLLFVVLIVFFSPFIVKAEECSLDNISIEKIDILNKSENAIQKVEPIIDGNKLLFDIKLDEVGSFVEYKMIIKNDSESDFRLDTNYTNEYFNYIIRTEDQSYVIKKNESKEVFFNISYENKIPEELLTDGNIYNSNVHLVMTKSNDIIINPATGNFKTIILLLFIIVLLFLFRKFYKRSFFLLFFLFLAFTSISVYAMCSFSIDVESKIEISPSSDDRFVYTINKYDDSIGTSSYVWLDRSISDQIIKYNMGVDTGKNIYLKHKLVDNKVVDSYVEFNVTEEMANINPGVKKGIYSLRGSVGNLLVDNYVNPYYNDNLDVLRLAFGNDLSYCTDEGTYYVCNISGLNVYVDSNGCVGANNGSWYCDFYYDGNSACFE